MAYLGEPVIPASCPAIWLESLSDGRIATMPMQYELTGYPTGVSKDQGGMIMAGITFGDLGEPDCLQIRPVIEPAGSKLAGRAVRLHAAIGGGNAEALARMRQLVVERVEGCHGTAERGECWALGPIALREVIGTVCDEFGM